MISRRKFLIQTAGASAGLALAGQFPRDAAAQSQTQSNKELVLRLKKSQGTPENAAIVRETQAPNFRRLRGGMLNLAANARNQGFPDPGPYLREAFPDRVDEMVETVAEGEMVGLLWRIQGTHRGNLFGIAPTGRKIDVYEAGIYRVRDNKVTEAWFMADEAGLLKQLGATLPTRKDGKRIVPPVTGEGEDPDTVRKRFESGPLTRPEDRNRLMVARSQGSAPPAGDRTPDFKRVRVGFQHMRDYGIAKGLVDQNISAALPERHDRIDGFIAEGDKVWIRFKVSGIQSKPLYGLAPTNKNVELPEIGIMTFVDGKWKQEWYFGDELGMMLQLDALHMLQA